jgi:UDPglucose 6-dehydrogenase
MIGVVGLGFVGLTTALGFSDHGVSTLGYDINTNRTSQILSGGIPFYEPGLKEALTRNIGHDFRLSKTLPELVENSEIIFVCVGTPQDNNGRANLSNVRLILDEIIESANPDEKKIVLIKSTVPPSSTLEMQNYADYKLGTYAGNLCIGSNPEFLREGHAWDDFIHPDRIVVGICPDQKIRDKISKVYDGFDSTLIFTDPSTAEFLKYLSNTLLSTLISFSNEMSIIAKKIGNIDIQEAFKLLHLDKRFSGDPASIVSYIYPGCGYGGYCLPKDTLAIFKLSQDVGFGPKILKGNLEINEDIMKYLLEDFFRQHYETTIKIGILGLSFKPDSDDVRETPALKCIETLSAKGYNNILVYDPIAMKGFKETYPSAKVEFCDTIQDLLKGVKIVFVVTAWKEFKNTNFGNKIVYDLRYTISKDKAER